MFLIDTNILLHAVNCESNEFERTAAFLRTLPGQSEWWALSWNVIYEFLRVSTHPRVFANPLTTKQAAHFIQSLREAPNHLLLSETAFHAEVFHNALHEAPRLSGNILHDFHTAVLMREHGISEIVTFDRDFRTFPWLSIKEVPS